MSANNAPAGRFLGRAWRLLALSIASLVLGATFFLLHQKSEAPASSSAPTPRADAVLPEARRYIQGPEPAVFKTISYVPSSPELTVEGACSDAYYAVLIYSADIDYRESPLDAKYNTALPCPESGRYARTIDLSLLPLAAGERYYVIRAQQGERGQWYDAE